MRPMKGEPSKPEPARVLARLDRAQPFLLLTAIAVGLVLAGAAPEFAGALAPLVTIGVFVVIYPIFLS
jgi:ACR3 family arsenite efflux pump ArsB